MEESATVNDVVIPSVLAYSHVLQQKRIHHPGRGGEGSDFNAHFAASSR